MPNVGVISGSMYLDPSAYISGLNQAAQSTRSFQAGVERVSFAGFHRGIFATTTLLYGLNRIMSSMSQGMEEYTNMLGRIGTVADMTAESVEALANSMKKLSVAQGVTRTDIMGGMYTAAQSGFSSPAEMRAMATSGALLSRASGKEIDVKKSVDLLSVARQALGIGAGAVTSNRMTDLLLRGRDVGRWELDEMAHALGIPLTVYGNQFTRKIGGEETLRQLVAIMSTATLSGINPNMAATGTRRLIERSIQLQNTKRGDPLRLALRGAGFNGDDPIDEAMSSPMAYLNTILRITSGGKTSELGKLGFGSRDLLVTTSALRDNASTLNNLYSQLSYGNTAGTTQRYNEAMLQTYDAKRDQLRAQWQITSQEFMQASLPLIGSLTSVLSSLNSAAQGLPATAKSFVMLISSLAAMRLTLTLLGFKFGSNVPGAASGAAAMAGVGGNAATAAIRSRASAAASVPYAAPNAAFSQWQARRYVYTASRPTDPVWSPENKTFSGTPLSRPISWFSEAPHRKYPGAFVSGVNNQIGATAPIASKLYTGIGSEDVSQVVSKAVGGISKFGSAIWNTIGPMTTFAAAVAAAMKFFEGWGYRGNQGGMRDGKEPLPTGGKLPAFLTSMGHGYKMGGSFLASGTRYLGEMTEDYAREHGYVPGIEGLKAGEKPSKWQVAGAAAGVTPLGQIIGMIRGRPMGVTGYRKGNVDDAMGDMSREVLNPFEVSRLSKAGIKFDKFDGIKQYLDRYVSEQLNATPPEDWNRWISETEGGYKNVMKWSGDALKLYNDEIMGKKPRKGSPQWKAEKARTDHIVGQLGAAYRNYYQSFATGTNEIKARGSLFDQQANRTMTPNELATWQSSEYALKMQQAAKDLRTPVHQFAGQAAFPSFESYAANHPEENARFAGFDTYDDAKRGYFKASRREQQTSKLGDLLYKLPEMSTAEARKALTGIYGKDLAVDDVGIDRLRNINLSRYFTEKPRDQLGGKSEAMGYGSASTYNSIVSMTPPEIVELQANREAIAELGERLTQDTEGLLQDFDTKFEKYVAHYLKGIAKNTAATNSLLGGGTSDAPPSIDN